MENHTKLKKIRGVHRASATRFVNQTSDLWNRDISTTDLHQINRLQRKLDTIQATLLEADKEIQLVLDENEIEDDCEKSSEIQERIIEALTQLSTMHKTVESALVPTTHNVSNTSDSFAYHGNTHMPKLQIRKFDGDPIAWQTFWDSFDSTVHSKTTISTIDKFSYLVSFLTGDALRVIEGYRVTEANYQPVIDTLTERFGDKELAIFAHFDNLLALSCASIDTQSLQATYDETEKHIRSLVALGLEEETFGRVFIPIILSKLPRQVRIELHRLNGCKPWNISTLRDLLHNEIKARQMGELSLEQQKQTRVPRLTQRAGNPKTIPTVHNLAQNTKSLPVCVFCGDLHYSSECPKLRTSSERQACLRGKRLCFKCLSDKHMAKFCKTIKACFYCKARSHHSSLCNRQFPSAGTDTRRTATGARPNTKPYGTLAQPGVSQNLSAAISSNSPNKFTVMQTAIVSFNDPKVMARIYFDSGSSRSYVTSTLFRQLRLSTQGTETISSSTFEAPQKRTRIYKKSIVNIPISNGEAIPIPVLITDTISCPIQRIPIDTSKHPIMNRIVLADPLPDKNEYAQIDILIGADYYYKLINKERIDLDDDLILLDSKLGYIITGLAKSGNDNPEASFISNVTSFHNFAVSYQNRDIERFWKLEEIGVKENYQQSDDDSAVDQFNKSIQFHEGRYEVGWPWCDGGEQPPTNRNLTFVRFKALVKRLKSDEPLLTAYDKIIKDQIRSGMVEPVPTTNKTARIHYLPHHAVMRPDKSTTKIRIVFDASSKESRHQLSLNECLLRGPVFLHDLCSLLLRFRTFRYAVVADIEKAFLQVGLLEKDRDVTRFFWVKDIKQPPDDDNLIELRFCRVLFGIVASPFLLDATIKHHLRCQNTKISKQIADNIYVDNVIGGNDDESLCIEFYKEAKRLFSGISMNIREWYTNSVNTRQSLACTDKGQSDKPKVLGMQWNVSDDTISCSPVLLNQIQVNTKKHLVQAVSRIFDPCGLFSPVTVKAKALVQSLWKKKLKWDDALPDEVRQQWSVHKLDLQRIQTVPIARFVPLSHNRELSHAAQLHIFCDASSTAYAAVAYVKAPNGSIHLLFSKTRLAPTKPLSVPRLELMAMLVGARVSTFLKQSLNLEETCTTIWSDSKCSLYWMKSSKVLATFVQNRVREIRKHGIHEFRYIPTSLNPADIPSRGSSLDDLLQNQLWWNGPSFLNLNEESWPENVADLRDCDFTVDSVHDTKAFANLNVSFVGLATIDIERFSSLRQLLRVTAWVLRFVERAKKGLKANDITLSACELERALLAWVKHYQQWHMANLNVSKQKALKQQLGLFDGSDGIIRCKGRICLSELPSDTQCPMILPKGSHFTSLVIMDYHTSICQAGPLHTLSQIRQRFWIPHGRSEVKKAISRCLVCRRWEGRPYKTPKMAPLPHFRVQQTKPFQYVGVDYLGPLLSKGTTENNKCWISLFTCASTRAIHLELISSMSTDCFLMALRRFIALCGKPDVIISDNARQFKTANQTLKQIWVDVVDAPAVDSHSTNRGITWKFIPEYSPWMGGFYERLVADVKRALKKTLGTSLVHYNELQTLIYEISWVLNTRPLIPPADINDPVLTPAHLIGRFPNVGVPHNKSEDTLFHEDASLTQRLVSTWKERSKWTNKFWDIWYSTYLTSLRERSTNMPTRNTHDEIATVGSIVLIKDNLPRSTWKIGRISKLHTSQDGAVRSVTVQLPSGKTSVRPLRLLYPLECNTNEVGHEVKGMEMPEVSTAIQLKPKRKAATEALRKIDMQMIRIRHMMVQMSLVGERIVIRGGPVVESDIIEAVGLDISPQPDGVFKEERFFRSTDRGIENNSGPGFRHPGII